MENIDNNFASDFAWCEVCSHIKVEYRLRISERQNMAGKWGKWLLRSFIILLSTKYY
jgi:hypothetical protein